MRALRVTRLQHPGARRSHSVSSENSFARPSAGPSRRLATTRSGLGRGTFGRGLVGAPRRCSLQNQFNYPTAGPSRIVPLQFIFGDRVALGKVRKLEAPDVPRLSLSLRVV